MVVAEHWCKKVIEYGAVLFRLERGWLCSSVFTASERPRRRRSCNIIEGTVKEGSDKDALKACLKNGEKHPFIEGNLNYRTIAPTVSFHILHRGSSFLPTISKATLN